jgi:roadblock/LC7 domain-containing protein
MRFDILSKPKPKLSNPKPKFRQLQMMQVLAGTVCFLCLFRARISVGLVSTGAFLVLNSCLLCYYWLAAFSLYHLRVLRGETVMSSDSSSASLFPSFAASSSSAFSALELLPTDILRNVLFSARFLEEPMLLLCRFVSRRLLHCIGPGAVPRPPSLAPSFSCMDSFSNFDIMLLWAAERGYLSILRWLGSRGAKLTVALRDRFWRHHTIISHAAKGGHLAVIEWAEQQGLGPATAVNLAPAARAGHLELLRSRLEPKGGRRINSLVLFPEAARGGHIDILEWGIQNGVRISSEVICSRAARGGHLHLLRWARERGYPWDDRITQLAAKGGHLEVLQWARLNGCPWSEGVAAAAAGGGHIGVLRWALEAGAPLDESTVAAAARRGDRATIEWLLSLENAPPCGSLTAGAAAGEGQLQLLQWLLEERKLELTADLCVAAALGGHLPVLKWARLQGAPWDPQVCAAAATNGHLQVLQWARAEGCPWDENAAVSAAGAGHLRVLQWLKEQGAPWDMARMKRVASVHPRVHAWLEELFQKEETLRYQTTAQLLQPPSSSSGD